MLAVKKKEYFRFTLIQLSTNVIVLISNAFRSDCWLWGLVGGGNNLELFWYNQRNSHEAEGGHGGLCPPERIYYSIPPPQRIQNMIHKIKKNGNNDRQSVECLFSALEYVDSPRRLHVRVLLHIFYSRRKWWGESLLRSSLWNGWKNREVYFYEQ